MQPSDYSFTHVHSGKKPLHDRALEPAHPRRAGSSRTSAARVVEGQKGCMTDDRILLQGMLFHGYHGTLSAERELGQRFAIDVELHCDLRAAGLADDLDLTVDYGEVYRQVRDIVQGEPIRLTETVAERIAGAILDRHERVLAVRVRVAKPQVRLDGGVLAGSAVEIVRRRRLE